MRGACALAYNCGARRRGAASDRAPAALRSSAACAALACAARAPPLAAASERPRAAPAARAPVDVRRRRGSHVDAGRRRRASPSTRRGGSRPAGLRRASRALTERAPPTRGGAGRAGRAADAASTARRRRRRTHGESNFKFVRGGGAATDALLLSARERRARGARGETRRARCHARLCAVMPRLTSSRPPGGCAVPGPGAHVRNARREPPATARQSSLRGRRARPGFALEAAQSHSTAAPGAAAASACRARRGRRPMYDSGPQQTLDWFARPSRRAAGPSGAAALRAPAADERQRRRVRRGGAPRRWRSVKVGGCERRPRQKSWPAPRRIVALLAAVMPATAVTSLVRARCSSYRPPAGGGGPARWSTASARWRACGWRAATGAAKTSVVFDWERRSTAARGSRAPRRSCTSVQQAEGRDVHDGPPRRGDRGGARACARCRACARRIFPAAGSTRTRPGSPAHVGRAASSTGCCRSEQKARRYGVDVASARVRRAARPPARGRRDHRRRAALGGHRHAGPAPTAPCTTDDLGGGRLRFEIAAGAQPAIGRMVEAVGLGEVRR